MKTVIMIVILITLLACNTTVAATAGYTITDLGTMGGNNSYAIGLNNSGQVVGYSTTSIGQTHAFLWNHNSGINDLGTLGGSYSYALGINDFNQVIGFSYINQNDAYPFIWDEITGIHSLGSLGGTFGIAMGINNLSQVVGTSGNPLHAFVWDKTGGIRDMGMSTFESQAINDHGQITGEYISSLGVFLWDETTGLTNLGIQGRGHGLNNYGEVAGEMSISDGSMHAYIWQSMRGIVDLHISSSLSSVAWDINDFHEAVGYANFAGDSKLAYIWKNDVAFNLNSLISESSGWTLLEARSINNSGQIVGTGIYYGKTRGYLLTPVPEPSCLLVLCSSIVTLGFLKRRWKKCTTILN